MYTCIFVFSWMAQFSLLIFYEIIIYNNIPDVLSATESLHFSLQVHFPPLSALTCARGEWPVPTVTLGLLCPLACSWVWPVGSPNMRSDNGRREGWGCYDPKSLPAGRQFLRGRGPLSGHNIRPLSYGCSSLQILTLFESLNPGHTYIVLLIWASLCCLILIFTSPFPLELINEVGKEIFTVTLNLNHTDLWQAKSMQSAMVTVPQTKGSISRKQCDAATQYVAFHTRVQILFCHFLVPWTSACLVASQKWFLP